MPHRVAILLPSLRGGGAERVGVTLANAFVRAGHVVDLVLVAKEGPYLEEVDPAVRVVDLNAGRAMNSFMKLTRYLQAERPDALLSTFHHTNVIALFAKRFAGAKTRIVVRTPNVLSLAAASSDLPLERVVAWLAPRAYLMADAIIAVSRGVADDLCQSEPRLRHRMHVIYNPVVGSELLKKAKESVSHPWFSESVPILLSVGRLAAPKDYGTLLRAFALMREKRQARLLILGEGSQREVLQSLAGELGIARDISLPGFVSNPFSYMARATVYVLSSCREGLPNALVQAMALGTRIVSTDCQSGPREILHEGKYGKLVGVGDVEGLAEAMMDALDAPQPDVPEEVIARFRVENVAQEYLGLLVPGTC